MEKITLFITVSLIYSLLLNPKNIRQVRLYSFLIPLLLFSLIFISILLEYGNYRAGQAIPGSITGIIISILVLFFYFKKKAKINKPKLPITIIIITILSWGLEIFKFFLKTEINKSSAELGYDYTSTIFIDGDIQIIFIVLVIVGLSVIFISGSNSDNEDNLVNAADDSTSEIINLPKTATAQIDHDKKTHFAAQTKDFDLKPSRMTYYLSILRLKEIKMGLLIPLILIGLILGITLYSYFFFQYHKRVVNDLHEAKYKDSLYQVDIINKLEEKSNELQGLVFLMNSKELEKEKSTLTNNLVKPIGKNNYQSGTTVRDIDGNSYPLVKIGRQTWFKKNLKTTKFNDGLEIQLITSSDEWANNEYSAYCWYQDDEFTYGTLYGALYNGYAVNTGKLCPVGWHVPSQEEWRTLINFVGGEFGAKYAALKLMAKGSTSSKDGLWHASGDSEGTDNFGFTAQPGGHRNKTFYREGYGTMWWTTSSNNNNSLISGQIGYHSDDEVVFVSESLNRGLSIRCIKD